VNDELDRAVDELQRVVDHELTAKMRT
jgi:hypothetical protein